MCKRPVFLVLAALLLVFPLTLDSLALPDRSAVADPAWQPLPQEKMIDRRFPVGAGGTLEVAVGDSDVEVVPGDGDVRVEVFLEGRDMEKAREYFERQRFAVEQDGNTVRVQTDPERKIRFSWGDWRDRAQIRTRVSVPEQFNADVRTSDGDVRIERLRGEIYVKTSDGDVRAGALFGPSVVLKTSDGDVHAETLEAETVEIETSDGDLDLGAVTAAHITARTSDGDIRARRLTGDAEVKTSDGDVRIEAFHGAAFSARTSDGSITIDALIARESSVHSSDGKITLRRVEGALEASGSDTDIEVDLFKPDAVSLTTSDGNIVITAPANLPADVRLRGEDVRVASAFNFQGLVKEERAEGSINGGGPLLEARSSDGSVTLRAR